MRRRAFLASAATALVAPRLAASVRPGAADWFLVPMDDRQADHLKAYGVAFRALERGDRGEWLLNHRGGSFLFPGAAATARDATLSGVTVEPLAAQQIVAIRAEIQQANADAVPLEKAPRVAVYAPPNAAPWDDAVTMAMNYAGIGFQKVWDAEVLAGRLQDCDWLGSSQRRAIHAE